LTAPTESGERSESSEACRHQGERRGLGHWRSNRNLGDPDFAVPMLDSALQGWIVQSLTQRAALASAPAVFAGVRSLPAAAPAIPAPTAATAIGMGLKKRTGAASAASATPAKSALTGPCIADTTAEIGIRVAPRRRRSRL
jgi:hypothetical protein